jgi:hypothetical protein
MFLYSTGFWFGRLPDWTPSRNSLVPSTVLTVPAIETRYRAAAAANGLMALSPL